MRTHTRWCAAVLCGASLATALGCGTSSATNSAVPPTGPGGSGAALSVTLGASTIEVGQTTNASASGVDQNGSPVNVGAVTWSSSNGAVATVSPSGLVTALGPGTTQIVADVGGQTAQATLRVITPPPVATVTVSPSTVTLVIGATQQLTVTPRDSAGNALTGRVVNWSSSDPTKATVTPTGLVEAIAAGTATIVATVETKAGSATVTVAPTAPPAPSCGPSTAMQLGVGEVRTLTATQASELCIGGLAAASEYLLVSFNHANTASTTTQVELSSTGTSAVTAALNATPIGSGLRAAVRAAANGDAIEAAFRARERRDIGNLQARAHAAARPGGARPSFDVSKLIGMSGVPAVGSIVQLNANLNGNTCSDPPTMHSARVVAVTRQTIVFLDTQAPAGGYTDAQLTAFATQFDTIGYPLDTTNFGANTDIDGNGRVGIFFTPGINEIPGPVGGVIGGLFAARDLFPPTAQGCPASNDGEMFYMPVPDPNRTINGNYTSESELANLVEPTLVHEFQHLINAGRRIYVNNAPSLEEVWLNEGLSHIAEELLYYRMSGNAPLENIDVNRVRSSQAQVDAFNMDESQNFARLASYLGAPWANSPYAQIDGLAMRGAIWQLLRYAADQKGGDQRATWYALVNSTLSGQDNFNAVFGDIVAETRNWAVAQFTDDMGIGVPPQYTNPSWNFRSVYTGLQYKTLPLATQALVSGTNVQDVIDGGGASYVRFHIDAGVAASIAATSQGQAVPPNMDFILVRTQ